MDDNRGTESWQFVKQVVEWRWFLVLTSFPIMIECGSPYMLGTYTKLLKTKFDYNQTQLNTLGFAKDLGSNLEVFAGILAEVAPLWMLFLVGISSNFFNYFMIWLSVSNYIPKPHVWLMFMLGYGAWYLDLAEIYLGDISWRSSDIYLEIFDRDVFIRLYLHKSLEAIFSKLKPYIYPLGRALKMYFSSFPVFYLVVHTSSLYFLSPVLCVHLDRVCALLSDPNNWYQS